MSLVVDLAERSYPIIIEANALQHEKLAKLCQGKKVCVVTNKTIAPLYLDALLANFPSDNQPEVISLNDGERFKTLETANEIFTFLLQQKLNRSSILIALGGGVIGDMTGFAAACYQRGIAFIQIPTTLLSQVDSSVGGKTGVNHALGKNMIGAFHQPQAVFIDTNTLDTLPDREFSAGMAEVIKYGLIFDAEFFFWLEQNIEGLMQRDKTLLAQAIQRSCEIKAEVVAQDEQESGIRAILNLGHTFGHAIETVMGYGEYLHGEAVAIGMVMAVHLSIAHCGLAPEVLPQTKSLLQKAGLPIEGPAAMNVNDYLNAMSVDKKNIHGSIRLILMHKLGAATVVDGCPEALIMHSIGANAPSNS